MVDRSLRVIRRCRLLTPSHGASSRRSSTLARCHSTWRCTSSLCALTQSVYLPSTDTQDALLTAPGGELILEPKGRLRVAPYAVRDLPSGELSRAVHGYAS
jgi:hypothetical protein